MIIHAEATGDLSVELIFNDNSRQRINVGAFVKAHSVRIKTIQYKLK